MTRYRVSDGVESYYYEADSPDAALDQLLDGYDWGAHEDWTAEECAAKSQLAENRYAVYDEHGVAVLSGSMAEFCPHR